jgi:hypothetical protein
MSKTTSDLLIKFKDGEERNGMGTRDLRHAV